MATIVIFDVLRFRTAEEPKGRLARTAFWRVCVVCSAASFVVLSSSGQRPIFPQNSMEVGPPNFEGYRTGEQTRIPVNANCWPLKLKINKNARLHTTRTRRKSGPGHTPFSIFPVIFLLPWTFRRLTPVRTNNGPKCKVFFPAETTTDKTGKN